MAPDKDGPQREDLNTGGGSEYTAGGYGLTEDFEETRARRPLLTRIVALATVLAFLGLIAATSWPGHILPMADLVEKSFQLKKDANTGLTQAGALISVVSRVPGSSVSVEQKTGTGFNVDPGGVIVTNHHVVENALNVTIKFPDGKVYKAERWLSKPESDLAVIFLRAEGLPAATVNMAGPPAPGDKIRVAGNPSSLNNIVVEGKVGRYLRIKDMQGKIFSLDAPVYPGNSGSPVFDMSGRVVGVVFGVLAGNEGSGDKAAGLAVTIDEAMGLAVSATE